MKVLDFGLAKALVEDPATADSANSPTLSMAATKAGIILGTAAYMSPEQARGKPADRRADIWSFGVVLYEMLTGKQAFHGETVSDTLAAVIRAEPNWAALPAETPSAVRNLLRLCLEKDSKRRLRDIGDAWLVLDQGLAADSKDAVSTAPSVTSPSRLHLLLLSGLVLAVCLAGIALWTTKPSLESPVRRFSLAPPPGDQDSPNKPVISPDGTKVAYTSDAGLWIHDLRELVPRLVQGTRGSLHPFWSPDSYWVAYGIDRKLWKVAVSGGAPVAIADLPEPYSLAAGGGWNLDGRIVLCTGYSGLYEVSDKGGDLRELLKIHPETDLDFHGASTLPNGKGVLFYVHPKGSRPASLELFDGRSRKLLLQQEGLTFDFPVYSSTGHILYRRTPGNAGIWAMPFSLARMEITGEPFLVVAGSNIPSVSNEGTLVYASGDDPIGINQLVWVDRSGRVVGKLGQPQKEMFDPSLSPDGQRVAVSARENDALGIWIYNVIRDTSTRLTFSTGQYGTPAWSPRGDQVAYFNRASAQTGLPRIVLKSADGKGEEQTIVEGGRNPSFAPDGKVLAFERFPLSALEYISLGSDKKIVNLVEERQGELHYPRISPDGHYLLYTSTESGQWRVYVKSFPSGDGKWQVSPEGGRRPQWGRDGKELFYIRDPEASLMSVAVEMRPAFSFGTPRKLFDLKSPLLPLHSFDVGADGKRFVMVIDAETGSQSKGAVIVVQNWFAEFKDKQKK